MTSKIKKINNDTKLDKLLNEGFTGPKRSGYVEIGKDKYCLPDQYRHHIDRILNFSVRDDDVFIAAHPKTGTTWMEEMVWLIINNFNYNVAESVEHYTRFPQLEVEALFDFSQSGLDAPSIISSINFINHLQSPRCIKTHLPWSLLPEEIQNGTKKPKIITTLRRPEDVCVSLYHHSRIVEGSSGPFEDFCEIFLGDRACYGPFWKQVLSYWEQKDRDNILFIRYKDMKDDLSSVIRTVAEFLGKPIEQDQIGILTKHLSFESMKNNAACNNVAVINKLRECGFTTETKTEFIRSGKVGGYKSVMSPALIQRFRVWTEENLQGIEFSIE